MLGWREVLRMETKMPRPHREIGALVWNGEVPDVNGSGNCLGCSLVYNGLQGGIA